MSALLGTRLNVGYGLMRKMSIASWVAPSNPSPRQSNGLRCTYTTVVLAPKVAVSLMRPLYWTFVQ